MYLSYMCIQGVTRLFDKCNDFFFLNIYKKNFFKFIITYWRYHLNILMFGNLKLKKNVFEIKKKTQDGNFVDTISKRKYQWF